MSLLNPLQFATPKKFDTWVTLVSRIINPVFLEGTYVYVHPTGIFCIDFNCPRKYDDWTPHVFKRILGIYLYRFIEDLVNVNK